MEPWFQFNDFRLRRPRSSEAGEELRPGDREESCYPWRPEQEGIVVFRPHGPRDALAGQPRCLGLPLARRLDMWDAEQLEESFRLRDHFPCEAGRHHRLRPRGPVVPTLESELVVSRRFLSGRPAFLDLARL